MTAAVGSRSARGESAAGCSPAAEGCENPATHEAAALAEGSAEGEPRAACVIQDEKCQGARPRWQLVYRQAKIHPFARGSVFFMSATRSSGRR